jgi:hypothetical protein
MGYIVGGIGGIFVQRIHRAHAGYLGKSLTGLVCMLLFGCQDAPPPNVAVMPGFQDRPAAINVVDSRPGDEKTSQEGSSWMTNCMFGVFLLGDEVTVPPKLVVLRRDLEDALGTQLGNSAIVVVRYRMFLNQSAYQRAVANGGYPTDKTVASAFAPRHCIEGTYDASEVTTAHSPIITEISVMLAGTAYSVRSVYSPQEEVPTVDGAWGGPNGITALFGAMHQADAALVEKLRTALLARTPVRH